jgi:hypothetical protein
VRHLPPPPSVGLFDPAHTQASHKSAASQKLEHCVKSPLEKIRSSKALDSPVVSELQVTVYRLPSLPIKISPLTHGFKLDVGLGCCPLLEAEDRVVAVEDVEETPPGTTLTANCEPREYVRRIGRSAK